MKMTARWRRHRRWNLAADRNKGSLFRLETAHFEQQRLRVRMVGRAEQLLRRTRFDDASKVHDQDAIA